MAHANARTTVYARKLIVARVLAGHRPGEVAKQLGISRQTVYKWVRRFRAEGQGLMSARTEQLNTYRGGPDERGHFGLYGGRFVAETLMPLILDLERAYNDAKADPAFKAEPLSEKDVAAVAEDARKMGTRAFAAMKRLGDGAPESAREAIGRLQERHDECMALIERLAGVPDGAVKIRIHGDYHLGQVLVAESDLIIVDFEGEPSRPADERRAKSMPLRDVAGLLRSFDYAAAAAAQSHDTGSSSAVPPERREALLARFRQEASDAFLAAYRVVEHAAERPWVPEASEQSLLDLFLIEKAAYEIRYEAANRPAWLPLPLRGLAAIVERLIPDAE